MNVLAVLALAGLLAGPASPSPGVPSGASGPVSVQADTIIREPDGRVRLEGNVLVRRGVVSLRSRTARVDPESGEIDARGDVLLTDATRAISADGIHAVLGGDFEAEHVVAFVKEGAVDLGGATTADAARRNGRNRLTLTGARLAGERSGRLSVTDVRLTLCDCGGAAPSWEIRAGDADVVPGERAILSWPVLYITPRFLFVNHPVPVLVVPWLFLPLGERHTGLLLPVIGSTEASGFGIAQPLFVTLGRSADATVAAEYLFGRSAADVAAGKPSVRGPGARLELRWVPAVDAAGTVEAAWVDDSEHEPGGAGGNRLGILGNHQQGLGAATRLRLDLGLASDPVWWRDFTPDVLLRQAFYKRSDLLVSHRSEALVLEGSAAYYQPLTPTVWNHVIPSIIPGVDVSSAYGTFGSDIPVFHRWPGLAATLLPESLGPVSVSGRLGLERFAPASGAAAAVALGPGDPGGRLTPAGLPFQYATEREAVTRLDSRLELRAPLLLGGALEVEPYLRGAVVGYSFDTSRDAAAVAWAVAGAEVSTELSRKFAVLTHRITPRLEFRAGTGASGPGGEALGLPAYDPWDRVRDQPNVPFVDPATGTVLSLRPARTLSAVPDGGFQQLRVSVENRLGVAGRDVLRVEVGQDVDVARGRMAETFFFAGGVAGPVAADLSGRILAFQGRAEPTAPPTHPSWLDPFTQLRAGLSVGDPRGAVVRAGLLAIGSGASGTLMAGVDPLFDLRPAPVDAVAQGSLGARVVLGGATVGYDALFPARPTEVPQCGAGSALGYTRRVEPYQVQQHAASLVWDSPCHCFLTRFVIRLNDCGGLSYSASIDLSHLGERAQFR